ncbi:tetratricopeptide repeat protein [Desulfoscipio geothermicus]|nr:tetratricopeptide repeat protein [Desulfoscipio geothermicus]
MKVKKAEELAEKGKELLDTGDFRAAQKAFAEALELDEAAPIRNNLALAAFMAGEPRRALEVLEPYLDPENEKAGANPFTYALAGRIHCSLGRKDLARRLLQQAVRSFEEGMRELRRSGRQQDLRSFREYTVIIMRAAADLEDHRLVFDLYRRWESHHISWENKFLAAAACFNIGRYKRSASLWSSIAGMHRLFAVMQQLAFMVERGVIPPFEMGYELHPAEKLQEKIGDAGASEEARRRYVQDSYYRVALLAWIFEDDSSQNAGRAMYSLVYYGDEWGEKLGRQVLEYSGFSPSLKMAAADALMARGILREGEPVPMFINGQQRLVEIKKSPVSLEPDEELDEIVARAIHLRDNGQTEEAIALLQDIQREGKFYPPALMILANLLRHKGELDEALQIMKMLEEIAPEEPALLFNLAALMLQMGEPQRAREYLERIDDRETGNDFRQKLKGLKKEIELAEVTSLLFHDTEYLSNEYAEEQRLKIEEKPLPADATLARGLKKMLLAGRSLLGLRPRTRATPPGAGGAAKRLSHPLRQPGRDRAGTGQRRTETA